MSGTRFKGWSAYGKSVVDVFLPAGVVTLGREGVIAGESWTLAGSLSVITAYNPGRAVEVAVNEAAHARLVALLVDRGIDWLPATGRSRDGSWEEPSVALPTISEREAIEIARDFDQDAIFSWDGRSLRVVPCGGGRN